jgi:hypothetical protein
LSGAEDLSVFAPELSCRIPSCAGWDVRSGDEQS